MGLIFTKGDLKEVSEEVAKYKVSPLLCIVKICAVYIGTGYQLMKCAYLLP